MQCRIYQNGKVVELIHPLPQEQKKRNVYDINLSGITIVLPDFFLQQFF